MNRKTVGIAFQFQFLFQFQISDLEEQIIFFRQNCESECVPLRRISGAHVHVDEDGPPDAKGEKVVTLSGTKESILLAQFLVQSNVDMASKDTKKPDQGGPSQGSQGPPMGPPQNGPGPHNNRQQNDPRLRGFRGGGRRGGGGRS